MRKTKKTLAILALVAMVLTMIPMQLFAADDNRIEGATRYETAIAIAEEGWADGADTVILAAGDTDNLVDALAAASLAGQEDAPILLTGKATLNKKVADAIEDLGASKVILVGAVKGLEDAVKALGVDVEVLAGDTRWETAAKINAELDEINGTFVVAYNGVADALSVASYAAANSFQIVLADAQGKVADDQLVGDVYTVGGGVKAIDDAIDSFAGANRFDTNAEVVEGLDFDFDVVYVANGLTLADALAIAPVAAKDNAAVLLASASEVKAADYVNGQLSANSEVIALGGTASVSNAVLAKVGHAVSGALTISGFKAVAANQLQVDFSKAVDTDAAQISVKRTNADNVTTAVTGTLTWNDAKNSVVFQTAGKLMKGSYSVTVDGLNIANNTATATVEDEKVAKVEILGDDMVKVPSQTTKAYVYYRLYNQYNEDVTKNLVVQDLLINTTLGTPEDHQPLQGRVTIEKGAAFVNTDTTSLTIIDRKTAVSATKTLTFRNTANIQEVTFGEAVLPSGKTRIETGLALAASIPLTVKDVFGNTITDKDLIGQAIAFVSNYGAVALDKDANNKPILKLDTQGISLATNVQITALVKATGASFNHAVSVGKTAAPDTVAFAGYDKIIAAGDSSLAIPIVVTDQYGNQLDAQKIADNAGALTIQSSNPTVLDANDLMIATSGEHKGKIVLKSGRNVGIKGSTVLMVTVQATGKTANMTLSVQAARYPAEFSIPSSFSDNYIQGATSSFKPSFKDQYGESFSEGLPTSTTDSYMKASLTLVSGTSGAVAFNGGKLPGDTAVTPANAKGTGWQIDASPSVEGTYQLKLELYSKTASSDIAPKLLQEMTRTLTVVKNDKTGLSYSIEDIKVLAGKGSSIFGNDSPYAREVKVVATDAGGAKYAIPAGQVFNVVSSNASVALATKGDGTTNSSSKWYVVGQDISANNNTADKTATITAYISTAKGVQQASTTVTVRPETPVAQNIVIYDKPVSNRFSAASDAKQVSEISNAKGTISKTFYAYAVDQYGVHTLLTGADVIESTGTYTPTYTSGTFSVTISTAGDYFFTFFKNGQSATLKLVVTN